MTMYTFQIERSRDETVTVECAEVEVQKMYEQERVASMDIVLKSNGKAIKHYIGVLGYQRLDQPSLEEVFSGRVRGDAFVRELLGLRAILRTARTQMGSDRFERWLDSICLSRQLAYELLEPPGRIQPGVRREFCDYRSEEWEKLDEWVRGSDRGDQKSVR